jgi:DNA primase
MGRIPDETIDAIRDRIDIVDLVGRHLTLRKAGQSFKGLCPFHDEKTPSFNVNPGRQIFYCFGCAQGGNAFSFLMKHENLTFPEAARQLARECGIEIPEAQGGESGETERLLEANEIAQRLYRDTLESREGTAARAYLEKRGLSREHWQRYEIGFAPDRWDAVREALSAARIPASIGERAGLLAPRKSGGHYDRLRARVTFPIRDARSRIVGFGGRAVQADQEPKYLNTPESPLFRKRESFYGLSDALEAIRRRERCVIAEGYFDRIALAEAGLPEALATCGTALGSEHARQLRRRTHEVVLIFDGDEAGQRAVRRALEVLLPAGLRVRAAALPDGEDPDSLRAGRGDEALRELVEAAPAGIDIVIRAAAAKGIATPYQKADAVADVAPILALVPDAIERSEFTRRLALATAVEVPDAQTAVREARGEREPQAESEDGGNRRRMSMHEARFPRRIAELLLNQPALASRLRPGEPGTLPLDENWQTLLGALADAARSGGPGDLDAFGATLEEDARDLLLSLGCSGDEPQPDAERIFDDTLDALRERRRSQERQALTRRLAEDATQDETKALLLEKQLQLEQKRAARGLSPTPPDPGGGVELLP